MKYLLSLDVGTTSLKAVLFDRYGKALAIELQEYELNKPAPDIVEVNPKVYWDAAKKVINSILAKSQVYAEDVLSVGVTSQGETLIAVDKNGEPLRAAIVWLDNRSQKQADEIGRCFDIEDTYKITGQHEMAPTWTATRILWLRKNERKIFERTHKFLLVEDYLLFKLTGRYITDCGLNPSTLYFDIINNRWWEDMLTFLGISSEQLPELSFSGERTFAICAEAVHQTGLSEQTVVTTAPIDQIAAAVGAGNFEPGIITETTGAALAICATFGQAVYDPEKRTPCHTHGVRGKYILLPWVPTAGMAFRWFRDEFCGAKDYAGLCDDAGKISPGADGLIFLPYLSGAGSPEIDPAAKGLFWGITLGHRQAHFTRAILESVAFMLKRNIDFLESLGLEVKEVRSLGGGAKSDLWLQIKADMLNKTVVVMECEESTCLGAAMLSYVANGVYKDLAEAGDNMVRIKKRISPKPDNVRKYEAVYNKYLNLHNRVKELFQMEK